MELIKRKIALDDFKSRDKANWGELTAKEFNINLFITSNSDDMGLFTDLSFIPKNTSTPNYQILIDKLNESGFNFNFMFSQTNFTTSNNHPFTRHPDLILSDYFKTGTLVTGYTEDRLDSVRSYDINEEFKVGFDISREEYLNFRNDTIDGTTRVIANNSLSPITYVDFGDINDLNIGNSNHSSGILFNTDVNKNRVVSTNDNNTIIPETEFSYNSEGFNETNSSLSAITKEEYLFGITEEPNIESDVFIDRGLVSVNQSHIQLSEISNMGDLINYGNGYYNVIK